ncbi:MAG: hypothetical protein JSR47_22550 [Proteobacteria bacterium]|nr:hypothetical protein [Pseudomonadota bacterium]
MTALTMRAFCALLTATWLSWTLCVGATARACAQERPLEPRTSVVLEHDKDLVNDTKNGVWPFRWSPDSSRIAYVKWRAGQVGIVDVKSGNIIDIPDLKMRAITTLTWSLDGKLLAISSAEEVKVVRLRDLRVINSLTISQLRGPSVRFGAVVAFSEDAQHILFQNPNPHGSHLFYKLDLRANTLAPLGDAPYTGRNAYAVLDSGRFQWHAGHLYYSVMITRGDEIVRESIVVGQVDYGHSLFPRSCFVFDLGKGLSLAGSRSLDFPRTGVKMDASEEIFDCRFSAASDTVVVRRAELLSLERRKAGEAGKDFFDAFRFGANASGTRIPDTSSPEAGAFSRRYELYSPESLMVTIASLPSRRQMLTVWDFKSGRALGRTEPQEMLSNFQISPDGSRVGFANRGDKIVVYKLARPRDGFGKEAK